MKLVIQPNTKDIVGIVDFIKGREVVKVKDDVYPIVYNLKDITTLYSLPTNNKHSPYTKRKNINLQKVYDIYSILKYWTPYKIKQKVKGYIHNNKFYVV